MVEEKAGGRRVPGNYWGGDADAAAANGGWVGWGDAWGGVCPAELWGKAAFLRRCNLRICRGVCVSRSSQLIATSVVVPSPSPISHFGKVTRSRGIAALSQAGRGLGAGAERALSRSAHWRKWGGRSRRRGGGAKLRPGQQKGGDHA